MCLINLLFEDLPPLLNLKIKYMTIANNKYNAAANPTL